MREIEYILGANILNSSKSSVCVCGCVWDVYVCGSASQSRLLFCFCVQTFPIKKWIEFYSFCKWWNRRRRRRRYSARFSNVTHTHNVLSRLVHQTYVYSTHCVWFILNTHIHTLCLYLCAARMKPVAQNFNSKNIHEIT